MRNRSVEVRAAERCGALGLSLILVLILTQPVSASYSPAAFAGLDAAIRNYQSLVNSGGWPELPGGLDLQLGEQDTQVALLRERLILSGDHFGPGEANPYLFEPALDRAVRRFQARHGLPENGIVSKPVREAMNVSASIRLAQLLAARATWQEMSEPLGERYVWINLPSASLHAVANGSVELSMRTVVGRPRRPTPVLRSQIRHLVLNPYWTVPPRIAKYDLLPKQQKDPEFFTSRAIRVFAGWQTGDPEILPSEVAWHELGRGRSFPYRLRQDPGPGNSLGQVKIVFDNDQSIFLHDTPARGLFELAERALSSGCVRLEDALSLSRWLLSNNKQSDQARVAGPRVRGQRALWLSDPVPVYLVYFTAWLGEAGEVNFRPDIYARIPEPPAAAETPLTVRLSKSP
jgi:murein L,D-transpeptidase YcbB/YkuD